MTTAQWLAVAASSILLMCAAAWLRAGWVDHRLRRGMTAFGRFNLAVALGILLVGLPLQPRWVAHLVGDLLILLGFVWLAPSLRHLFGLRRVPKAIYFYGAVGALADAYFGLVHGSEQLRSAATLAAISMISMHGAAIAARELWARGRVGTSSLLLFAGLGFGSVLLADIGFGLARGSSFEADLSLSSSSPVVLAWLIGGFLINAIVVLEVHHRSVARLEELALTDVLTKLPNRRAFERLLEREAGRAGRSHGSYAIIIGDVDDFKIVNDQWGHAAGDQVLANVAVILGSALRRGDVLARYGGDEFAMLLPEADRPTAEMVCERLRLQMQEELPSGPVRTWHTETNVPVTLSFGVAAREGSGMDAEDVMRRADQALYRAKRGGRNRFCVAS